MGDPVSVPTDVAAAVKARWPDIGQRWCSAVADEFADISARYGASPIAVLPARYGLVVAVEVGRDTLVMRSSPDPDGMIQSQVSIALGALGTAPQIYEVQATDTGTWTVMDRITPGTRLSDVLDSRAAVTPLADIFRRIAGKPAPTPDMPRLADWLRSRLEAGDHLIDRAPGRSPAPSARRAKALEVLNDLEATCTNGLCHGDASAQNVLTRGTAELVLIDPRGVAGEVAYDGAVAILKTVPPADRPAAVQTFAALVGLDAGRVAAWLDVADAARV